MSEDTRTPTKIIRDWWGVIVVFLGIVGGYAWLDERFEDINKLKADRAELESQIKNQKQTFEASLRAKDCELQYTIAIEQTSHDIEADVFLMEEMQELLPNPDDVTPKAVEDRRIREKTIKIVQDRRIARLESLRCLTKAQGNCEKNSKVDTKSCSYLFFYK